jgi:magnesium-transporting ATPase (P-type)
MNTDNMTAQTEHLQKNMLKGSGAGSVEGLPRATVFHKKDYLDGVIGQKNHVEHSSVDAVMMLLALCHTVVIDRRTGKFNSSSPDEIALLQGAKDQGYEFIGKREGNVLVVKIPSG